MEVLNYGITDLEMSDCSPEETAFTPRNYQVQLMEIAIKQNTIIYLPTGSGKTFIALMVLKQLSQCLLRSYTQGGKISVILVNSVALASQHCKYVKDHTIFTVGVYTGEMNLDFWSRQDWMQEFDKYQVIIMTSQIFVNLINNCFIDLEKVNLIIFDECHRGVDDQPMRQVMKSFQNCVQQPRILGLTATLLNGNCKLSRVMSEVQKLEITYHSKVATVNGLDDVIGYSTNPKEMFKLCETSTPSNIDNIAIDKLTNVIQTLNAFKLDANVPAPVCVDHLVPLEPNDILRRLKNLVTDLTIHIVMLGSFGAHKACISHMIQVERLKKHCDNNILFCILNYVLTIMGYVKEILKKAMEDCSDRDKIYKFSSDKVIKLFEILAEYESQSSEELCCLIFVQRRFTAKVLHHVLQNLVTADQRFAHIKSNFIVGNKNNPYNDTRENLFISKKNREVLDSFINKEINVLVSSNVLEEGVDIPKCTLVVKFDKAMDYRSYIQSKGRARHRSSLFYTIVEEKESQKYHGRYQEFHTIETLLNDLLVGKNSERDSPSKTAIDRMYNEDDLQPYFTNGYNSAQVNMTSAIPLLCRYCNTLSRDQYTVYNPEWYMEKSEGIFNRNKIRVVVLLPVVCPILEPIRGPFMTNKKDAKRAAALRACIELHKCGELDDNLLPTKKQLNEEDISFLFGHFPEKKEGDAGNKKKKRLHDKEIASCIKDKIDCGTTVHLHVIKLDPLYHPNEDFNLATVYNLYKTGLSFGVVTPNPLPDLCKFPIFDSNGCIEVEIKVNVKTLVLSKTELMQLREFHYLIFNDLLEILKPFLIFDNTGSNADMLLVVPVQDGEDDVRIDFSVIEEHKTLKSKQLEPSSSERTNLKVTEEDYLHKIVSPWYRTQPSMYVVTRVCVEKTPRSSFPNEDFGSFVDYYEDKHSLKILNSTQPLLLVKGLSKRLNTFKPRGRECKRKKEKRYEELEEYLIPELVVKQEFPSCLWIKSRFLPTILSRVAYLLKLQQLQVEIALDIGAQLNFDVGTTVQCLHECPPLELDLHLLHYVPSDVQFTKQAESVIINVHNDCLAIEGPSLLNKQYNKDFAAKMLESEYAWRTIEEPKDIERDIDVTVMDIEHYETFISHKMSKQTRLLRNQSPVKTQNFPAITYNKEFEEKQLEILAIEFDNQCPNLCEFYQALTAAEANDIVNLERLETLGDSFLKFIASLYVIFKFPAYNEGKATTLKGKLVSNKNLYYLARMRNLGGVVKNSDLSPNDEWVPPCFCVPTVVKTGIVNKELSVNSLFNCNIPPEEQISGVLTRRTLEETKREEVTDDEENSYASMCNFLNKQYVGDKTLADAVEALLGAFFRSGGIRGGIKFVEWIGILPRSEDVHNMIEKTRMDPILNPKATAANVDFHIPQWQDLEARLGYRFKNRAFLLQALTHSSYSPNRITQSYERLEFVGDAILDFLITCYIYEHCDYLTPGQVTDLRSALVNNNTFASLAVRCGFHKFLLMINTKLQAQIDKFAEYLAMKDYVIDDEVLILLEQEDCHIAEYVDVPKVLGDIFEALAGAVYLDCGKDLKVVWKVFYKIMWREIDLFSKDVPKNLIRRLYECHTAYPNFSKAHELDNKKTMVALEFMCEGRKKKVHGFGTNKTMAKRAAAKIALRALRL